MRAGVAAVTGTATPEAVLTPTQLRVLQLVSEGLSNKEIAHRLACSESTVAHHRMACLERLGAANTAQAVAIYVAARKARRPAPVLCGQIGLELE